MDLRTSGPSDVRHGIEKIDLVIIYLGDYTDSDKGYYVKSGDEEDC